VPDPITTAIATTIATAVAGQAAQTLTGQATHALAEICTRVRQKFHERPAELAVLATAQSQPSSQKDILLLAGVLRQAAHEDPEFGREIFALWGQAQTQITTVSGNVFHGRANKVVQLHDVHGDLTIS
jgi:hypothetical protein